MFRWSGPSFLALLEREASLDAVCAEVARWGSQHLDYTLEVGERTVMLSVSISSLVLPVWQATSVDSLVARIDAFVLRASKCPG